MRAKKHLGQHFLTDGSVVHKILEAISEYCPSDRPLLEVGPGPGVLTRHLVEQYSSFKAVEYDHDMVPYLVPLIGNERLILGDFLRLELDKVFDYEVFSLAGNFPYNISSQIIFKMIDHIDHVPVMVGMFQKELAERICANPGSKQNGIISIRAQAYYSVEKLFDIGPEAFSPPPKVNSSVIVLKRHEDYELPCDERLFNRVVKQSFGQRRKKLRNTLKSLIPDTDDPIFQKRPEELSVSDFVNITKQVKEV